jgi:hypothetical protein
LSRLYKRCKHNPLENLNQKQKTQWNRNWVGLPKVEVSTKPIVPQNLSIIPNNRIMSMKHTFQDISKHMMETTYTLRLSQLLKITPNLLKYMWQKLKLEKPNIINKIISKPNVTKVVETHSEVNIAI